MKEGLGVFRIGGVVGEYGDEEDLGIDVVLWIHSTFMSGSSTKYPRDSNCHENPS